MVNEKETLNVLGRGRCVVEKFVDRLPDNLYCRDLVVLRLGRHVVVL